MERLATEGATVAIFDINKTAGEKVAAEPSSRNLQVSFYQVDVTSKQACVEATKKFADANSGKIHYLVNCAVYFGCKTLNAEEKDWEKSFSVNVTGYANMVIACHEFMSKLPGDKSIVNVSSTAGTRAQVGRWTYAATKGAINSMTRCMALDLSKDKIRVNSISPAWVWSPEVSKAADGDREKWEPIWGPHHMLRRMAEMSEVASAICFFLSDDASFVTGSDLTVDGGYSSMSPEGLGENSKFAGTEY